MVSWYFIDTSHFVVMKSLSGKKFGTFISTKEFFLCTGGTYLIQPTITPKLPGLSYNWTINSKTVSADSTLTVVDLAEGSAIKLIVTSDFTCLSSRVSSSNELEISNAFKTDIEATLNVNRSSSSCSDYILSVTPRFGGTNPTYKWSYGYDSQFNRFRYTNNNEELVWEDFSIGDEDFFQVEVTSSLGCVNQKSVVFQYRIRNLYDFNQFDQLFISSSSDTLQL